jgi:hypothetical protein
MELDAWQLSQVLKEKGYDYTKSFMLGYIWQSLSHDQKQEITEAILNMKTKEEWLKLLETRSE